MRPHTHCRARTRLQGNVLAGVAPQTAQVAAQLAAAYNSNPALAQLASSNPAALAAQLAAGQAGLAYANAMRVSVDKGRQTDYDHQFVAEDTTAKDHADEVMRRCEEVTKMLRKTLGKHTEGDRCGGQGGCRAGLLDGRRAGW